MSGNCVVSRLKKLTTLRRVSLPLILGLLVAACSHSYTLSVEPPDAVIRINGESVPAGKEYATGEREIMVSAVREGYEPAVFRYALGGGFSAEVIRITLEKQRFAVEIDAAEGAPVFRIDGEPAGATPFRGRLAYGAHTLTFEKPGLPSQTIPFDVRKDESFLFRYQEEPLPVRPLGIFSCGRQPKQLTFSPDNRFLFITLLDGEGFQVFDLRDRSMRETVTVGPKARLKGFPEGLFVPKHQAYFISQMSTNYLYEYGYTGDGSVSYRRMIRTDGVFPKFIAYSDPRDLLAVSNWITNDVSIIDYRSWTVVKKIPDLVTPRGLAFSSDGRFLFVASYDGGFVSRFSADSWLETNRFSSPRAAMRHIVLAAAQKRCFVSDMAKSLVFELQADDLSLLHVYKVAPLPNTIELSSDGRFLFVSCRGPNNPVDYTLRSPENGKVLIFDTGSKKLVATIAGGNQPTGLDVSGDNRLLVFSNFLDADFEIYDISGLYEKKTE